MSADAMRFVQRYSITKGIERSVEMAIARASKHRVEPFIAEVSYDEIAAECGILERSAKRAVKRMLEKGRLLLIEKGTGHAKNRYEITAKRGVFQNTPGVSLGHPSYRGGVIAQPRAEIPEKLLHAEVDEEYAKPNVIPIYGSTDKTRPRKAKTTP